MVNVAVIGCGKIAQVRHLPEYQENPDAVIYGLYDQNQDRARELASSYHAKAYNSLEELLADPAIDAVSVCVANNAHADITVQALNAGKHVLCEKPMAMTLADCEKMVAAARQAQKYLMIGQNQRLAKAHVRARDLIRSGEIGRIITFRTAFGHSGPETWSVDSGKSTWFFNKSIANLGAMADLGVHKTDLIHFLCESYITKVSARLCTLDKQAPNGEKISVEDNAFCTYELENGVTGTMTASWTYYGPEDNSTVLYGTDGIMRIYDDPAHSIVVNKRNGERHIYDIDAIQTNDNQGKSGIIDAWIDCIVHGKEPEISGEEILHTMKAIFAAIESDETGKVVTVDQN